MSADSATSASRDPARDVGCSLCGDSLDDDGRFVQCYPEDGCRLPAATVGSGFLAVCVDCDREVTELIDAWRGRDDPPVGDDHSIAAGYRRVADDCSFCDRPLGEGALLGVEYYGRGGESGDDVDPYANYSLCADCVPVFDEFLQGLAGDAT